MNALESVERGGRMALADVLGVGKRRPGASGAVHPALIEEREPRRWLGAFAPAAAGTGAAFLVDPSWGSSERAQLAELLRAPSELPPDGRGWLMIASGGTSGRLKFARHDEATVAAAVRGFCRHFGAERVHAVGTLPLHHVSGFMAWMRCLLTGGTYVPWEWKALERGELPALVEGGVPGKGGTWCVSLVPTQLHRLMGSQAAVDWLRRFDAVLLGGGPPWPELLDQAAKCGIPLCPSYGMTETAAMAAALRPADFRAGARGAGTPLPHVSLSIDDGGAVLVEGDSLFRGYYPGWRGEGAFATEDLGSIDAEGRLHVLGRRDAVIITGGKKADPAEIEAALRSAGLFEDVAVVGVPDAEWGQQIVACYPGSGPAPDRETAARALAALAPHKRPRRFMPISPWPRNAQGKLNRAGLVAAVVDAWEKG